MKKKILVVFSLLFTLTLLSTGFPDAYKKGAIFIIPDETFGNDTDWDGFFYAGISGMTFCPDGSFFASPRKQHKVLKFDANGHFLFEFGQEGTGPGDFRYPGKLSILDDTYLIVGESPMTRRISIFNLDGKFLRLVRTIYPVVDVVSLKNNKVAILTQTFREISMLKSEGVITVYIKDISTGVEKKIMSESDQVMMGRKGNVMFYLPGVSKIISIQRSKAGNLLVGNNHDKTIFEYSPDGVQVSRFEVIISPVKVTTEIIEKTKEDFIAAAQKRKWNSPIQLKAFEAFDSYKIFFKEYLPFYNAFTVDSDGNILVYTYNGCFDTNAPTFQVYSPEGKYVCECKLIFGEYEAPFFDDQAVKKFVFHNGGLYGLFKLTDRSGDEFNKLVKTTLK